MTEKQAYQERVNIWCVAVPPRCSSYKIKFRTVNKTQILKKERVIFECCGNYCCKTAYAILKVNLLVFISVYCLSPLPDLMTFVLSASLCIEGYAKNKAGTECKPICTECKHGACTGPERCKCDPGYFGPACDISKSQPATGPFI